MRKKAGVLDRKRVFCISLLAVLFLFGCLSLSQTAQAEAVRRPRPSAVQESLKLLDLALSEEEEEKRLRPITTVCASISGAQFFWIVKLICQKMKKVRASGRRFPGTVLLRNRLDLAPPSAV